VIQNIPRKKIPTASLAHPRAVVNDLEGPVSPILEKGHQAQRTSAATSSSMMFRYLEKVEKTWVRVVDKGLVECQNDGDLV
jgi:hypothetical protein